ncbi:MAG: hypothetical protein R3B46_13990 [Phycisphaerales bacterium]
MPDVRWMIVNARVGRVVYGAADPKAGAVHSLYELLGDERLNHRVGAIGGVLAGESSALLREFFRPPFLTHLATTPPMAIESLRRVRPDASACTPRCTSQ